MALFGGGPDAPGQIKLSSTAKSDSHEELEWERELLGLYISDHPLSKLMRHISHRLSNTSNEFSDVEDGAAITVGGMVKRSRALVTKKGDDMAFVTLEDNFGEIEIVMFPNVWAKSRHMVEPGSLLVIEGKMQHQERGDSIIADAVARIEVDENLAPPTTSQETLFEKLLDNYLPDMRKLSRYRYPQNGSKPAIDQGNLTIQENDSEGDYAIDEEISWFETEELSDPFFDMDHPLGVLQSLEEPEFEAEAEGFSSPLVNDKTHNTGTETSADESLPEQQTQQEAATSNHPAFDIDTIIFEDDDDEPAIFRQWLKITIPNNGDRERVLRHIAHIYGILQSYPGKDQFSFSIPGTHKESEVIFFPNDGVRINQALLNKLRGLLGDENVSIQDPLDY